MRKLSVQTFVSLDGVMQAPGGPDEDRSGGFEHGGWVFPHWDETVDGVMSDLTAQPFEMLLGRRTYDIFAAYWPHQPDEIGSVFNKARKYVVTRTLEHADWHNTVILRDVARDVAALKRQDGPELRVIGSGDLIQSLLSHDLVDELSVWTFPVLLGGGKRLFGSGTRAAGLALSSEVIASPAGVVIATYQRAGEVRAGSFADEQPSEAELARRASIDG